MKIAFDQSDVFAVTDHDAITGDAVTCVYGVSAAPVNINETVSGFLERLDITAKFAKLTRPNSSSIWICGSAVTSIRATLPGEYDPRAKSVVNVGSLTQAVCQDTDTAIAAVNAHGGKL